MIVDVREMILCKTLSRVNPLCGVASTLSISSPPPAGNNAPRPSHSRGAGGWAASGGSAAEGASSSSGLEDPGPCTSSHEGLRFLLVVSGKLSSAPRWLWGGLWQQRRPGPLGCCSKGSGLPSTGDLASARNAILRVVGRGVAHPEFKSCSFHTPARDTRPSELPASSEGPPEALLALLGLVLGSRGKQTPPSSAGHDEDPASSRP